MAKHRYDDLESSPDLDDAQPPNEERTKNKHGSRYDAEARRKIDEKLERRRLKKELEYYDY